MRFLSVCSGIEAASVAWNPLGWKAVAFSEIEPFPCAVLAHHYSDTPNWGDMTRYKEWPDAATDLLCGGTPCQSYSVAGLRKGLADPRGDLMLTFGAIAGRYRPRWLVWENVPGVLSSNEGRDFGTFLGMLGQLGYGFAYRVLDAQYFGVPQRRRRVFVVGCLGDWRAAAAVLFERHSLSGHPAPSREARQRVAGTLTKSAIGSGSAGGGDGRDSFMIAGTLQANGRAAGSATQQDAHAGMLVARCLTTGSAGGQRYDAESETLIAHSLRGEGFDSSEDGTGRGTPPVPAIAFDCKSSGQNGFGVGIEVAGTQRAMAHARSHTNGGGHQAVVTTLAIRGRGDFHQLETRSDGTANALLTPNGGRAGIGVGAVHYGMQVRRLTPEECEALQAFPRGYTRIAWRGRAPAECPDGPRYKALGNSWCVTNVRWIGHRIQLVDQLLKAAA